MPRPSAPLDLVPAPVDSQSWSVGRDGVAVFDGEPARCDRIGAAACVPGVANRWGTNEFIFPIPL